MKKFRLRIASFLNRIFGKKTNVKKPLAPQVVHITVSKIFKMAFPEAIIPEIHLDKKYFHVLENKIKDLYELNKGAETKENINSSVLLIRQYLTILAILSYFFIRNEGKEIDFKCFFSYFDSSVLPLEIKEDKEYARTMHVSLYLIDIIPEIVLTTAEAEIDFMSQRNPFALFLYIPFFFIKKYTHYRIIKDKLDL